LLKLALFIGIEFRSADGSGQKLSSTFCLAGAEGLKVVEEAPASLGDLADVVPLPGRRGGRQQSRAPAQPKAECCVSSKCD
jgi:hypothetical protein